MKAHPPKIRAGSGARAALIALAASLLACSLAYSVDDLDRGGATANGGGGGGEAGAGGGGGSLSGSSGQSGASGGAGLAGQGGGLSLGGAGSGGAAGAGAGGCGGGQPVCQPGGTASVAGPSCEGGLRCGQGDCCRPDCCEGRLVAGGVLAMGRGEGSDSPDKDAGGQASETPEHQAQVDAFFLDTFEVTVGRFREWVSVYDGKAPPEGAGKNPNVPGSGWVAAWGSSLPASQAALIAGVSTPSVSCGLPTWSEVAGEGDERPINCVSWYEAFAFCVWDGGRLPTEAEWEFVAAGGAENRKYPWGAQLPNGTLASYRCQQEGGGACELGDILKVGSKPAGAARTGHQDMAGSVYEWVLDIYSATFYAQFNAMPCTACANLGPDGNRVVRGGSFDAPDDTSLRAANRAFSKPGDRRSGVGFRCAR